MAIKCNQYFMAKPLEVPTLLHSVCSGCDGLGPSSSVAESPPTSLQWSVQPPPSLTPCPGRNKNCPPSLSILNIRHYDDGSEMKRKGQKLPRKYQNPAQQRDRKPKSESVRKRGWYGGTTGNQDLLFDNRSDLGQLSGPISIQRDECLIKHSRR